LYRGSLFILSVHLGDTFAQSDAGPPAQFREPGNIQQLAHGSIRLGTVPLRRLMKPDHVGHEFRQFGDGLVLPAPDVDQGRHIRGEEPSQATVRLHQDVRAGVSHIVGMKNPAAPDIAIVES